MGQRYIIIRSRKWRNQNENNRRSSAAAFPNPNKQICSRQKNCFNLSVYSFQSVFLFRLYCVIAHYFVIKNWIPAIFVLFLILWQLPLKPEEIGKVFMISIPPSLQPGGWCRDVELWWHWWLCRDYPAQWAVTTVCLTCRTTPHHTTPHHTTPHTTSLRGEESCRETT